MQSIISAQVILLRTEHTNFKSMKVIHELCFHLKGIQDSQIFQGYKRNLRQPQKKKKKKYSQTILKKP